MAISMTNAQLAYFVLTLEKIDNSTTPPTITVVPATAADVFVVTSSKPLSLAPSFGVDPTGATTAMCAIGTPLVLESDATNAGGGITLMATDQNDIPWVSDVISISLVPIPVTVTAAPVAFAPNPNIPTAPGP